jgi:hypothetical protein
MSAVQPDERNGGDIAVCEADTAIGSHHDETVDAPADGIEHRAQSL